MEKILLFIVLFSSALCKATSIESVSRDLINEKNISVPSPTMKDWTVAIYMNGRSNIEPFALADLNRLETQGSDENINIVVEIGRAKGLENDTTQDGDWSGVKRFYVTKDEDIQKVNSIPIEDLGEIDMGDWKKAADFLSWAKENYPAKKFMFIIWDHGWGWIDPLKPGENPAGKNKSISHDFVSGNYIKTTELSNIFKQAGTVDLYASMACFMQMAEVAYEIRDYAQVIAGSEEVIQLPSFNFEDFFSLLKKNPHADAEKAGVYLTETFKEMYSRPEYQDLLISTKYGTQLSAIRGKKLYEFARIMKEYSKYISVEAEEKAILAAKKDVLRFEVGDEVTDPNKLISFYADICHFAQLLYENTLDPIKKDKAGQFYHKIKNYLEKELVVSNVYLNKDRTGKDYSNAHGISVHIPGEPGHLIDYHKTYSSLAFEKATSWSKAIKRIEESKK